MVVMMTGSRRWTDVGTVLNTMAEHVHPDEEVRVGDAKGLDAIVRLWWPPKHTTVFEADWNTHGRAAGPLRNARMLDAGPRPRLVLAFLQLCTARSCQDYDPHISHGTANAMLAATQRGIPLIQTLDPAVEIG